MWLPDGAVQPRKPDNTTLKALARAFRWKRMLESGELAMIAELAESEGMPLSPNNRRIAVKIVDDRGIESLKIMPLED